MTNIAFLVSNINPFIGGTERVTQSIAENLEMIGYNVYFIYTNADNTNISTARKIKINPKSLVPNIVNDIKIFITTNNIKVIIVVNRIFQSPKFQHIFKILKYNIPIKLIISLHASPDNWVNKNKYGLVLPYIYIKEAVKSFIYLFKNPHIQKVIGSYRIADKYLLLSPSYLKSFEETYQIKDKEHKLIAIPNPCPFDDAYTNSCKKNQVLIVSRMQEDQKRIYIAIKMWKNISRKFNNWKLIIVGDGPDINKYKQKAKHINNISFEGHSTQVQEYYKESKIFMMTSIWEGLPMTLIEAMHYGCVPIAFDSFAALHDIIINNQTGYIIPNNNVTEYILKLVQLLKDEQLISKISSNILSQPPKFQMNEIIKIWDNELKKLI